PAGRVARGRKVAARVGLVGGTGGQRRGEQGEEAERQPMPAPGERKKDGHRRTGNAGRTRRGVGGGGAADGRAARAGLWPRSRRRMVAPPGAPFGSVGLGFALRLLSRCRKTAGNGGGWRV